MMDFEHKNNDFWQPANKPQDGQPAPQAMEPVTQSQPPVQQSVPQVMEPVAQSQPLVQQPVPQDESIQQQAEPQPFAAGTQSYATYQQWQAAEAKKHRKKEKKPHSRKPLIAIGSVAAAAVLFLGGVAFGGGFRGSNEVPSASSSGNLPVLSISNTPTSDSKKQNAGGEMAGEDIYKKLNTSIVAIQAGGNQAASSGSGVIMSKDGYIITNAHVVLDENTSQPMQNVSVLLADSQQLDAEVKGYDEQTDLAVLKVEPKSPLTPAEFGDSDALQVGETAYAIGSPGGVQLANSMTSGIISAINRNITVNDRVMNLIQTNVTVNPGNSGGALINKYGQVVGITSAKLGISYYEGLGFAIPINSAKEIVDELIQTGYISGRPSIGIRGQDVSEQQQRFYNLPAGVQIASIDSRAKAASEGLEIGDIITAVNGKAISSMNEVNEIKEGMKAGEQLTLTVYRPTAQKSLDLKITLTDSHDLEGTDPAEEQQQQQQRDAREYYNGGYDEFDPFQFFFGY